MKQSLQNHPLHMRFNFFSERIHKVEKGLQNISNLQLIIHHPQRVKSGHVVKNKQVTTLDYEGNHTNKQHLIQQHLIHSSLVVDFDTDDM